MRSFRIENELIGSNGVKIIMYDYTKHVEKHSAEAFSCNRTACTLESVVLKMINGVRFSR